MIKVNNISVCKGENSIIKDVSFSLQPGRISVVVGKNGAGKSTLLEALTGFNPVSSGAIKWNGQSISKLHLSQMAESRAVLSQKMDINFPIQVNALVEMGTYSSSEPLTTAKIRQLIRHALKEVELSEFANRDFTTLSGGEQKRVMLAKCIVQLNSCHWSSRPKYLFLDEPTSSLDIQQQFKLIQLVKQLVKRRNIGVFAVLHDVNLAAQFADQILMLKDGQLLESGTPEDVLTVDNLFNTLDIHTVVQQHPVLDCLHITALPEVLETQPVKI